MYWTWTETHQAFGHAHELSALAGEQDDGVEAVVLVGDRKRLFRPRRRLFRRSREVARFVAMVRGRAPLDLQRRAIINFTPGPQRPILNFAPRGNL
jgi:hypothetical protein